MTKIHVNHSLLEFPNISDRLLHLSILNCEDAQEVQMLHAHKQALERDLEDEKQRLAQLREARNSANHESLAFRRDRKHLIAELRFLRHMAEEEEGLILVLQNSNQYLEASRGTLEASSAALAKISAESQCKSFDWLTPKNSMSNSSGAFGLRGNLRSMSAGSYIWGATEWFCGHARSFQLFSSSFLIHFRLPNAR